MTDTLENAEVVADRHALDHSPSHLLHRAQQAAADFYVQEFGANGVTQRQLAVLAAVANREGLTQTDLVKATGIDRSTLAEMIARMASKGLIARTKSELDSRANAVSLTNEGRTVLDDALPRLARVDILVLEQLPKSRRDGFVDVLRRMALGDSAESEAAAVKKKAEKTAKKDKKKKKKKKKAAPAE